MFANIKNWSTLSDDEQAVLLQRPAMQNDRQISTDAAAIVDAVRKRGDAAVLELTERFDGYRLAELRVTEDEFERAESALSRTASYAIDTAIGNVRRFHEAQKATPIEMDVNPGVRCERHSHAIDAVGLYVPSGSAPLPSAAIMLAVPAAVANCPTRILCSPADNTGTVNAATLAAARRSGIEDVFKIGGAQAIGAMAYGTETVPKVEKIFGPGNAWVTAAKQLVASDQAGAGIDMPAGPSEVLVIADESANPVYAAADLLSQAEHGIDSQVILLTSSERIAKETVREIETQLDDLPRKEIAREALQHSHIVVVGTSEEAIAISNRYAPEHLILLVENPRELLANVRNAGSTFLGPWSPESVGDYCSGANHVLPTYGSAKTFSGLGVEQFMRQMTVQELTQEGLRALAPTIIELAQLEGLEAHAEAVRKRLPDITDKQVQK